MNTKQDQKFFSKFLALLLYTAGVAMDTQHCFNFVRAIKYYLIYSFIFITVGQVMSLKFVNAKSEICLALVFIFNGIFLNTTTIILHIKKRNFISISNIVNNNFYMNASTRFKQFYLTYGVAYFIIYCIALLSPFLLFPISGKTLGDPSTLLVPSWFPWTIDTYLKYILTTTLQFSWLSVLSLPVLLGFMLPAYFILEVQFQFDCLCNAIQSTGSVSGKHHGHISRYNDLDVLKACIRQHQIILR